MLLIIINMNTMEDKKDCAIMDNLDLLKGYDRLSTTFVRQLPTLHVVIYVKT